MADEVLMKKHVRIFLPDEVFCNAMLSLCGEKRLVAGTARSSGMRGASRAVGKALESQSRCRISAIWIFYPGIGYEIFPV